MKVPGDSRNHYLARMEWTDGSEELVVQQLNRLQNTNRVLSVDVESGEAATIHEETDEAWVNVHDEMEWINGGKRFTWISESDGWRHVQLLDRNGGKPHTITRGEYDVIQMLSIDREERWCYFLASPEDTTQCYLYRIRLDGTARNASRRPIKLVGTITTFRRRAATPSTLGQHSIELRSRS